MTETETAHFHVGGLIFRLIETAPDMYIAAKSNKLGEQ